MRIREPKQAGVAAQPTYLTSPGRPGAIETGEREARGYELEVTAARSRAPSFEIDLEIRAPGPQL